MDVGNKSRWQQKKTAGEYKYQRKLKLSHQSFHKMNELESHDFITTKLTKINTQPYL